MLAISDCFFSMDCHRAGAQVLAFCHVGEGQVVITAPHGGTVSPTTLDDRTSGCMEPDTNSAELAFVVWRKLRSRGLSPSLVVGNVSRRKVDLARDRESCADTGTAGRHGRVLWDDYHGHIARALRVAVRRHGCAHLFDIHGQGHREATEVGHMLTNTTLRSKVIPARAAAASSISAMASLPAFDTADAVVRGPWSLGSLLVQRGYFAVPSTATPHPCDPECTACVGSAAKCACTAFDAKVWDGVKAGGNGFGACSFFWGAHTLARYAGAYRYDSTDAGDAEQPRRTQLQLPDLRGKIAATQLETEPRARAGGSAAIASFGTAIADSIADFMCHFYGIYRAAGEAPDRSPSSTALIVHPRFPLASIRYAFDKHAQSCRAVVVPGVPRPFLVMQHFASSGAHLGSVVWNAGIALATYITANAAELRCGRGFGATSALELGCGAAAIVSQCAALHGFQTMMTDLPEVVSWAKHNVALNVACHWDGHPHAAQALALTRPGDVSPLVRAQPLEWGAERDVDCLGLERDLDYVFAADCIYATSAEPSLCDKLLCTLNLLLGSHTQLLISYQCRRESEERDFIESKLPAMGFFVTPLQLPQGAPQARLVRVQRVVGGRYKGAAAAMIYQNKRE